MFNLLEVQIQTRYRLEYIDGQVGFGFEHEVHTTDENTNVLKDPRKVEHLIEITQDVIQKAIERAGGMGYGDENAEEIKWVREQAKYRTESASGQVDVHYVIDYDTGNVDVETSTSESHPITFPYYGILHHLIQLYADLERIDYDHAYFQLILNRYYREAVANEDEDTINEILNFLDEEVVEDDELDEELDHVIELPDLSDETLFEALKTIYRIDPAYLKDFQELIQDAIKMVDEEIEKKETE